MRYFHSTPSWPGPRDDIWGWDPEEGKGYWMGKDGQLHSSGCSLQDFTGDPCWEEFAYVDPDLQLVEGL